MPPKSADSDFLGRFREIVSDPLNLLIERHPLAGVIEEGLVHLHNGHRVLLHGPGAYYDEFSQIFCINRGVHEPLEELVFQELMRIIPEAPQMIELGAYWGHYSMWLKQCRPAATVRLVEPDAAHIEVGIQNFLRNGYKGFFNRSGVGPGAGNIAVDRYLRHHGLGRLDILHADIQGAEAWMLRSAAESLAAKAIDYLFVSTHSQALHQGVVDTLAGHGYRVEVSSDFDRQTTSYDGFVFASSPEARPLFDGFAPLGREDITGCSSAELLASLAAARQAMAQAQTCGP